MFNTLKLAFYGAVAVVVIPGLIILWCAMQAAGLGELAAALLLFSALGAARNTMTLRY